MRLAIQMLIDADEDHGPMLFARMGIQRRHHRNIAREPQARAWPTKDIPPCVTLGGGHCWSVSPTVQTQ
jgi:hypothetical protein